MRFTPMLLWTDILIFILMISVIVFVFWVRRKQHMRDAWRQVISSRMGMISAVLLSAFVLIGVLDSIHYRPTLSTTSIAGGAHFSGSVKSVLDKLLSPLGQHYEKTYSAPFATHLYVKETVRKPDGTTAREYPHLKYAGIGLHSPEQKRDNIISLIVHGILYSLAIFIPLAFLITLKHARSSKLSLRKTAKAIMLNQTKIPMRTLLITTGLVILFAAITMSLSTNYHIFGTNKVGQDIFYQTIKSIRTGLVIGSLTTLIMLPFAILMGTMAGYYGGLMDDVIQYIYTTLSSIPGVLLIAAAILSIQVFIANHPDAFPTLAIRADTRLLALCIILGITSWTSLCRVLRAETLKLREMDYIHAAIVLGTKHLKIILRHILPNVMHIILITVVLDFSGLVLAEAVLSYVGVGVDPTSISWGNMINSSRLEMAREPVVWWPLLAAFLFMFTLVLSANLFADKVRDAFDPRTQS